MMLAGKLTNIGDHKGVCPLVSSTGLMVLILLWRPQGLYPVAKR